MNHAAYDYTLVVTDASGSEIVPMGSAAEAHILVGRVLGEFITHGFVLACPLFNPGFWVATRGAEVVDIQIVTIGKN